MRTRILATIVALTMLAGAALPLAAMAQDDEDQVEERRRVEVSTSGDGVEIELEREDASTEDKVEMAFETEDATFELKHEAKASDNETEQKLEAVFHTLAEYRDTNDNSAFDPGEPIVSAWSLGDDDELDDLDEDLDDRGQASWETPTVEDITVQSKTGKLITAPATIGENGTFELRMYVFGDFVDLANSTLEPTDVKIDIVIDSYPYEASDTALTLLMETKTELEQEHDVDEDDADEDDRDDEDDADEEEGDDEDGVSASGGLADTNVTLRFTWKDHATVDGTDRPVHTTVLETEREMESDEDGTEEESKRTFALSYARGETIVHDPTASVDIQSTNLATSPTPGWSTLLVLAGISLTALAARVRRS